MHERQIKIYAFATEREQARESKQEAQEGVRKHDVTCWPSFRAGHQQRIGGSQRCHLILAVQMTGKKKGAEML